MWRLAVPPTHPLLVFCLCSCILLLMFSVFDTSPPLPLPWLPIFHFSDTNTGSSSLMASLFWNYKVLPRKATCTGCKNRETFVDQMLSLLLFQLTRAFLRHRLSEHTVALAFPAKGRQIGGSWRRTEAEGGRASACAQTAKPHPPAQRSITNKSLRVQESADSLFRSPSHE